MNDDDKKEFLNYLKNAIADLAPKQTDPIYRYAEALLIVFDKYADPNANAIEFNYKDLYELIKGEDAGRVYVSEELLNKMNIAKDREEYKKLHDEMEAIEFERLSKHHQALDFMEKVSDALNLSVLCDQYKREVIIAESEGERWVAIDLKKINITKIDF